ncbi:MAG: cupin domain-containing protein [Actinobacteria bacterium]|nr:MAG: cupin domain-containing protein [Actinomycetota bacterium]
MNLVNQYCHFYEESLFVEESRPGFKKRVVRGDNLELWFWRISGGAIGSVIHQHTENEQLGIIVRGKLDFRIGQKDNAERVVLSAGDVYLAPKTIWHGDSIFIGDEELNEVWILDVFSPPRQDTIKK